MQRSKRCSVFVGPVPVIAQLLVGHQFGHKVEHARTDWQDQTAGRRIPLTTIDLASLFSGSIVEWARVTAIPILAFRYRSAWLLPLQGAASLDAELPAPHVPGTIPGADTGDLFAKRSIAVSSTNRRGSRSPNRGDRGLASCRVVHPPRQCPLDTRSQPCRPRRQRSA